MHEPSSAWAVLVRAAAVCLVLGASGAGLAQPFFDGLDWRRYDNERYGVRLLYPARLFEVSKASEGGDGHVFLSRDGLARLLVGVLENREQLSPSRLQDEFRRRSYARAAVDYAPTGRNWFVLSGAQGDKIFYEKVVFSCDGERVSSFAMVYPATKRRLYDLVAEHIERSYRASFERQGCR